MANLLGNLLKHMRSLAKDGVLGAKLDSATTARLKAVQTMAAETSAVSYAFHVLANVYHKCATTDHGKQQMSTTPLDRGVRLLGAAVGVKPCFQRSSSWLALKRSRTLTPK